MNNIVLVKSFVLRRDSFNAIVSQCVPGTIAVVRPDWVRGRTLLVVDDIMTTGATLSECARVLKESGAWRVWCATLARTCRS